MAVSGLQWPIHMAGGGRPAAVFYPFGHPMPYAYGREGEEKAKKRQDHEYFVSKAKPS
jgi:hypothetical protein